MSIGEFLYTLLIKPLYLIFETVFSLSYSYTNNVAISIVALSLIINILVLPLYIRADAIQEEENIIEKKLHNGVKHIKRTFHGDEQLMMLQTYYRQNNYKPTDILKGALSLFLEIPFFIAAYRFLSNLSLLNGVSLGPIADLGKQDCLLKFGGVGLNVLPFIMTFINFISTYIYTKDYPLKKKLQLYAIAFFFLVFLYDSPSGLLLYWTLNNIFSLLKTIYFKLNLPRKTILISTAVLGIFFLVVFFAKKQSKAFLILGIICILPILLCNITQKTTLFSKITLKHNSKIFWINSALLAVIVGALVPSAIISSSPQEFIYLNYYYNPIWFVVSTATLSVGVFVVWLGIFYSLTPEDKKVFFEFFVVLASIAALVDYMFFCRDLGTIDTALQFGTDIIFRLGSIAFNLLIIAIMACVTIAVMLKNSKMIQSFSSIITIAVVIMSAVNISNISRVVSEYNSDQNSRAPHITLSKDKQNVIVIMLDKACGVYIPYIFNEKPELFNMYDGFSYYNNTISFGLYTNFASPAFYGGYEYTPLEINKRNDVSLKEKQNEALLVMPVSFSKEGYNVTVCDPTYANYQWIPDLSIYDDYENIDAYNLKGMFCDTKNVISSIQATKRNMFCHSLFRCAPILFRGIIYNNGEYHNIGENNTANICNAESMYKSKGISDNYMASFSVLQNLANLTQLDGDSNCFVMMSNDSAHDLTMLQEPDYIPSEIVDNEEFEFYNSDRFNIDGKILIMDNNDKLCRYQCNMASIIQIGKWLDYLKEIGVYDNTRIIIASDHGSSIGRSFEDLVIDTEKANLEATGFFPLLMVKDFNSKGFNTLTDFMTNADVPSLAMNGLITNPINPSTGKIINDDNRKNTEQYLAKSENWHTSDSDNTTLVECDWYTVHNSIWDKNNWEKVNENSLLPY